MNKLVAVLPEFKKAEILKEGVKRAYIGAYGFEDRARGWASYQNPDNKPIERAFVFKYLNPKGPNKVDELKKRLKQLGASRVSEIRYDVLSPHAVEDTAAELLATEGYEEIIVDVSGMTKLAILLTLCQLKTFPGTVRVAYSEAVEYCPTIEEYDPKKGLMQASARFPSYGAEQVVRLRCLSSIRMQGQPLTLVAFASFNEKLVSHMLGFVSPHRVALINGHPPRIDYAWRERATQDIHRRLCTEYAADNPVDAQGLLVRKASTLDYRESVLKLEELYEKYGLFERIVCGATGSKMQTVGLFFAKARHPDIQVEYPTPDSYYFKDMTNGVREVHEVIVPKFGEFLLSFRNLDINVSV